MNCEVAFKLLCKDRLTPAEQILLEAHLGGCSACGSKFRFLNESLPLLKEEVFPPPSDFTQKVMLKINSSVKKPAGKEITAQSRFFSLLPRAAFAAAAIIIGFIFLKPQSTVAVTFKIMEPGAHTVALAGDFNNWDTESLKLKKRNGSWKTKTALPRGRFQYAFIIDGEKWVADPYSKDYMDNGYGSRNSIIDTTNL